MIGQQLIRYHTLSVGLGIHFSTGLRQRKISFHQSGILSINQLSVPEHKLIYFGEQASLFKVLQQSAHYHCYHPSEWCEPSHVDVVTSATPQLTPSTSILFRGVGYLLHVIQTSCLGNKYKSHTVLQNSGYLLHTIFSVQQKTKMWCECPNISCYATSVLTLFCTLWEQNKMVAMLMCIVYKLEHADVSKNMTSQCSYIAHEQ